MALVLANRVKETTTTTGQGTVTLAGAATGYQAFSVIGDGNTTYYTIAGQATSEWEVGIGTYTSSGTTLSRDTVLASSAGAPTKTTFTAGTKDVFVTYPSEYAVTTPNANTFTDSQVVERIFPLQLTVSIEASYCEHTAQTNSSFACRELADASLHSFAHC